MSDFIRFPFASAGDRDAIPAASQVDGTVSFEDGFGSKYSLDLRLDPDAYSIPRDQFNQLMYATTSAVRYLQVNGGVPEFITTADNGGTAFSYGLGALVRYDDSGVKVYRSKASNNTALPTDTTKWGVVTLATGLVAGSITNVAVADNAQIDAAKIADASVTNAEYQRLAGVTSAIQTQIDGKQATGNYITSLTGDVTASGAGAAAATLAASGVTAGEYFNANVTVDAKGRITSARNGASPIGLLDGFENFTSGLPSDLAWTSSQAAQIAESVMHVTQGTKSVVFTAVEPVTMSVASIGDTLAPLAELIVDVYVGTIGVGESCTITCGANSASTPVGTTGAFVLRVTIPDAATGISLGISDSGQCWWDNLRYRIKIDPFATIASPDGNTYLTADDSGTIAGVANLDIDGTLDITGTSTLADVTADSVVTDSITATGFHIRVAASGFVADTAVDELVFTAPVSFTLNSAKHKTSAGTTEWTLKNDTTAITGGSSIEADSTFATATFTAGNEFDSGEPVKLSRGNTASAEDLEIWLDVTWNTGA